MALCINCINTQIINQAKSADNAERDICLCHAGELGSMSNELCDLGSFFSA